MMVHSNTEAMKPEELNSSPLNKSHFLHPEEQLQTLQIHTPPREGTRARSSSSNTATTPTTTSGNYSTTKRSSLHRSRPFSKDSITYKVLQDIAATTICKHQYHHQDDSEPSVDDDSCSAENNKSESGCIHNILNHDNVTITHNNEMDVALENCYENDIMQKWVKQKITLIHTIHDNVVGAEAVFKTPFSTNRFIPITYCDYIASGKPLKFIEDYLFEQVLPTYANTHTTTSFTGYQTTHFREEAREIIAECVNARLTKSCNMNENNCASCSFSSMMNKISKPSNSKNTDGDCDVVLFVGSGSTSAVNTLVHCIGIRERVLLARSQNELPVVFISPYEHHSNILPWRESGAIVIQIAEDRYGNLNFEHLKKCLLTYKNGKRLLIGSFSAASNVTGVCTDCDAVCKLCHEHGAFCFFDYAASAPYVPIDMNPTPDTLLHKDAIFISPHKFVGGPGTPGLLIAKRKLFMNAVPTRPGGGTVNFVDDRNHSYTAKIEEREEGGTPDIIGSIRCALIFKLKEAVGPCLIGKLEDAYRDRALEFWSKNPNLILLGPGKECISKGLKKLAFFSFLVKHGDIFLHHSFVSLLLNDLFGIQTRGGCSCAGPLGIELLGISHETALELEGALLESYSSPISLTHLKPGWTRLNLNYFFDDETVDFVLKAVDFVATHGWKFLPYYVFNESSNEWMHRRFDIVSSGISPNLNRPSNKISSIHENFTDFLEQHRKRISDITFEHGRLEFLNNSSELHDMEPNTIHSYSAILQDAEELLQQSMKLFTSKDGIKLDYKQEITRLFGDNDKYGFERKYGHLRWYLLPSEALMELRGLESPRKEKTIFVVPKVYPTPEKYVEDKVHCSPPTYISPNSMSYCPFVSCTWWVLGFSAVAIGAAVHYFRNKHQ
ncbi:hypothetical protein C9374_007073 [Naegleria lovaniensis]|uniref:Aminotransferase class V domain-containing protein n=1 Tax=Naegleria lovaniensis TaxID=51637 RepID=A0AA88H6E9_NAELO|nr:uncharacterized protein C9374_007073 [Naegleria lovaniensis]KAG2393542.1 hypothetical protein C9374_007073 [Naegleria lovaniensis]